MARSALVKLRDLFAKKRFDSKIRRGLVWELTFPQYLELVLSKCHYCGRKPHQKHAGKNSGVLFGGIDRIDNKFGYTVTNSLPACSECNAIRNWNLTVTEAEVVIKELWRYRRGKRAVPKK